MKSKTIYRFCSQHLEVNCNPVPFIFYITRLIVYNKTNWFNKKMAIYQAKKSHGFTPANMDLARTSPRPMRSIWRLFIFHGVKSARTSRERCISISPSRSAYKLTWIGRCKASLNRTSKRTSPDLTKSHHTHRGCARRRVRFH